jgi:hypothetical protein
VVHDRVAAPLPELLGQRLGRQVDVAVVLHDARGPLALGRELGQREELPARVGHRLLQLLEGGPSPALSFLEAVEIVP